ncbi:MAG: hypothetical protein WBQ59_15015, partial [Candidatus Acidiferrum sp.]
MIVSLYIIGLFVATLLGILLQDVPGVLIAAALCLLAATLALVRGTALRLLGTTETLCVLFFSLAVAH